MAGAPQPSAPAYWLYMAGCAALIGLIFYRDGIDIWSLTSVGMLIVLAAGMHFASRLDRPARNYFVWGLATIAIGLVLVAMPAALGRNIMFGAITWAAIALLGLIWVVHYERTEPR